MCIRDSLYRVDDNRLTKQIFKYLWGKKSTSSWMKEVQKDLQKTIFTQKKQLEDKSFGQKC